MGKNSWKNVSIDRPGRERGGYGVSNAQQSSAQVPTSLLLLPINTPSLRPCSESRTLDQMRANVFPPSIKHPHKNSPTTPHTRQPHARDPLPPSLPPWLPPHHHPSGRQHSPVTGPLARCESRGPQPRARALPAARRSGPARLHRAPPPAVERAPQGRPAPCWPPPRGPSAAPRARPAPLRSPQASSGAPPELRLSKGRRSGCPHPGPASPDPGRWRGGEGGGEDAGRGMLGTLGVPREGPLGTCFRAAAGSQRAELPRQGPPYSSHCRFPEGKGERKKQNRGGGDKERIRVGNRIRKKSNDDF